VADNWNSNNLPWNFGGTAVGARLPVMINSDEFYQADSDNFDEETGTVNCLLERIGIPLLADYVHPSSVKLWTRFWPVIRGRVGDAISISMGMQEETTEDTPIYLPAQDFIIGTTQSLDGAIAGRYACIKFEATNIHPWTLIRYQLEWEVIGRN
jgi:hypothetical protein